MRVASVGAVGPAVLLLLLVPRAVGMLWHDVATVLAGLPMTTLYGSGGVLAASLIAVAALSTPVVGRSLGRMWDRAANGPLFRLGRTRRVHVEGVLHRFRKACTESITAGWGQLTMGVLAYLGLQAALLAACLVAVGAHIPLLVIAAAFGLERILSLFPFTPGGAGIAELGSVAVLVALGGDPALMAAGVLLYRTFTFLLEIPVGGVSTIVWLFFRTQSASRTGATA